MRRLASLLALCALAAASLPLTPPAGALPPSDPLGLCPAFSDAGRTQSHGEAPPLAAGLTSNVTWAALKTGFRAVVAWSSLVPEPAELVFLVENASAAPLVVPGPAATQHVFVLDGLEGGRVLCFRVRQGAWESGPHALFLANAYNRPAGEPTSDPYTTNLLVVATEVPLNQSLVEASLDSFAQRLWDASDGWLRAGKVILLVGDPQRINLGHYPCGLPKDRNTADIVGLVEDATCPGTSPMRVADGTFTHLLRQAGGVADGYGGISVPDAGFWVNATAFVGLPPAYDQIRYNASDMGFIFLHEFAHYAFRAEDLYRLADGCYDAANSLSIMDTNPNATEMDSEGARCPDAPATYVPTWTRLTTDFPDVPARNGSPDPGPTGTGGAYALRSYRFAPA